MKMIYCRKESLRYKMDQYNKEISNTAKYLFKVSIKFLLFSYFKNEMLKFILLDFVINNNKGDKNGKNEI